MLRAFPCSVLSRNRCEIHRYISALHLYFLIENFWKNLSTRRLASAVAVLHIPVLGFLMMAFIELVKVHVGSKLKMFICRVFFQCSWPSVPSLDSTTRSASRYAATGKKNIHFPHFFTLKCGSPIVLMYGIIYVRKLWLLWTSWYGAPTWRMYFIFWRLYPFSPSHLRQCLGPTHR